MAVELEIRSAHAALKGTSWAVGSCSLETTKVRTWILFFFFESPDGIREATSVTGIPQHCNLNKRNKSMRLLDLNL